MFWTAGIVYILISDLYITFIQEPIVYYRWVKVFSKECIFGYKLSNLYLFLIIVFHKICRVSHLLSKMKGKQNADLLKMLDLMNVVFAKKSFRRQDLLQNHKRIHTNRVSDLMNARYVKKKLLFKHILWQSINPFTKTEIDSKFNFRIQQNEKINIQF
jgi:hypothetical protein